MKTSHFSHDLDIDFVASSTIQYHPVPLVEINVGIDDS